MLKARQCAQEVLLSACPAREALRVRVDVHDATHARSGSQQGLASYHLGEHLEEGKVPTVRGLRKRTPAATEAMASRFRAVAGKCRAFSDGRSMPRPYPSYAGYAYVCRGLAAVLRTRHA